MIKVIGVHTNAVGGSSVKGSTLMDGHAWLSLYYENGCDNTIGLWLTDGQKYAVKRFLPLNYFAAAVVGEEVRYEILLREEKKRGYKPQYSRFYELDQNQKSRAGRSLTQQASWRYNYTCASWVTEKIKQILGESVASGELFGLTNTPRRLGTVLSTLEMRRPTTRARPIPAGTCGA